jgi:hypothetical protein
MLTINLKALNMGATDIRFEKIAGVQVNYDRDTTRDYGTRGRAGSWAADLQFHNNLEICFQDLWRLCPLGQPEIITTAGTFVSGNPGLHGLGRAFDLDGIFWKDRTFVTLNDGFRNGDRKLYFGINAVLRKHFGVVLNYLYNADHRDHFHIDDSRSANFSTDSQSTVYFLQGALVHVMGISVSPSASTIDLADIDGNWGNDTKRGVSRALSEFGIDGSINNRAVWIALLDAIASRAFGSTSPDTHTITFTSPSPGQKIPIGEAVNFVGTADGDIKTVRLLAENRFNLGADTDVDGNWQLQYTFNTGGQRNILAKGFDANNRQIASQDLSITLINQPGINGLVGYKPPANALSQLGSITTRLDSATQVLESFSGGKIIFRLQSGELYIDADMDIDADGSPRAREIDPCCGQLETSLRYPNGSSVNSEEVPYFVLPGGFFQSRGIRLGDIAAVIHNNRIEYAILADVGPANKIGEGSIALSRSLGNEPIINGIVRAGIDEDVIYIIFPGSGDGTPQTIESVRTKGKALFTALGGNA